MKRFVVAAVAAATFTALLPSTAGGWSNVYGTDVASDYSSAETVELLSDGSAIVAGCFAGTFNGQTSTNGLDSFVMRVSPDGETLWTYAEDGNHEGSCQPFQVVTDDVDNIFVVDWGDGGQGGLNDWLIALDPSGAPLEALYPSFDGFGDGGFGCCGGSAVLWPADDGFAVVAASRYLSQSYAEEDGAVRRVSASGEYLWFWEPSYPDGYGIGDYSIWFMPKLARPDGQGGYVVVQKHVPTLSFRQVDLAVYRIDANGEELWSTLINGSCIDEDESWSFVSGGMIVLDSPSCATSSEQAARVLSLETGAVITEYDDAALRGDSMLHAAWPGSDCYEVNEARTLVVFSYDRCDSDLPVANSDNEWTIQMRYSVDEFADLGDGRVAALVDLRRCEVVYFNCSVPGHWFGVFEVVADGFLRPLKFEQIVSTDGENDSLRDVAVDPVSGRVVVVGRVDGASSVTLSPLSRSRSLQLQSSGQPNALTVSASSDVAPITHGFEDVPTDGWKSDAVYWLRESGVTEGCGATTFCPDEEMTREQQITFLYRYSGESSEVSARPVNPFGDVPRGRYFSEPIDWAFENSLTKGISQDPPLFGTGQPVTRAQAVTFLWRQAGEPDPAGPAPFDDVPSGRFFSEPVAWAFENGVTTGRSATEFDPYAPVKRVEFAAFLSRYDNLNLN